MSLADKRVVVVGASSGIGRGFAVNASQRGADVIVAARRLDRLDEVAAEAPGVRPLQLDLRSDVSRDEFNAQVRGMFDAVDVLFVSAGAAPLQRFAATTEEHWMQAIATNLIGVNLTIGGLVDLLAEGSVTLVVSSESAHEARSHLGAYGASKAALEHSIQQWREEHPWRRFSVVNLGATIPTEFGKEFDHENLLAALTAWGASGRSQATFLATDEVCEFLTETVASLMLAPSIDMHTIVLRSPSPPETDAAATIETARAGGQTHAF